MKYIIQVDAAKGDDVPRVIYEPLYIDTMTDPNDISDEEAEAVANLVRIQMLSIIKAIKKWK